MGGLHPKDIGRRQHAHASARVRAQRMAPNDREARVSGQQGKSPSQLIDARIEELGDWRGELLSRLRTLVKQSDPEVVEEWKWRGTPVFSHAGIVCTGETYKSAVKMTFAKGAALNDPAGLFNSSLGGNVRRAIDVREHEAIDVAALKDLIRAAVALNLAGRSRTKRTD